MDESPDLNTIDEEVWESLCDGCGRCCLVKLQDEDTGRIFATSVACRLFDPVTCKCRHYTHRFDIVSDCEKLTPTNVATIPWLPPSCAYRRLADGRGLASWHPLVSQDPASVEAANISVKGRITALEHTVEEEEISQYIVDWPWDPGDDPEGE